MNIYLQFVTFEQDHKMLDLFRLPKQLLLDSEIKEQFIWIGLNGKKASVDSLDSLNNKIVNTKFKQIGYEAKFKPVKILPNITLKEVIGVLVLPNTSPLWADEKYWEKGTFQLAYRRAKDAKGSLDTSKRAAIKNFPAVFELTLKVSTKIKQDEVIEVVASWLGKAINTKAFEFVTCVAGDVDDDMLESGLECFGLKYHLYSIVFFLYDYILGAHLLKNRIDRLHSIHIHNKVIMSAIAGKLDLKKPVELGRGFSILTIPKAMLNKPENLKLVDMYAIPQDDTTSWAGLVKRGG